GHMAEGYVLENAAEPERILAKSHQAVFGEQLSEHVTSAATDARFFGLYQNTPGMVYGPVCERPHGFDERVDLESVRQVTKTYALVIAGWGGLNGVELYAQESGMSDRRENERRMRNLPGDGARRWTSQMETGRLG